MSVAPRPIYAILGATGGIGSALARHLAAAGAGLLLGGRRPDRLAELAEETSGAAVTVDGTDFDAVDAFLDRAGDLEGQLRGIVNCAGSLLLKPAHLTTRSELDQVIGANLVTAFATVRAAARALRRDGGSIVLVSSAAARVGLPNHEAIAAAKAAVAGLTRSAAATYASRGLRVNAVAPGLVETPMTRKIVDNERALAGSLRLHALARVGKPREVAELIAWLLSDSAAWVTGEVWGVDGGLAGLKSTTR